VSVATPSAPPARSPLAAAVAGAAAGDEAAWALLVARYDAMLHAVARAPGLGREDGEDVAQTTWLRFLEHGERLRSADALGGWLAVIARREAWRVARERAREVPAETEPGEGPAAAPGADWGLLARERRARVHEAMDRLPERQRALLVALARDPAPSYAQLAADIGMPVGSIGPTLGRALERLRRDPAIVGLAA
jgi:RNA polymerase sigma factor (sigma-70 family)